MILTGSDAHIHQVFISEKIGGVANRPWQESRSREILEEKWLIVFSLELEKWIFVSRSPLDFQDFEKTSSQFTRFLYWTFTFFSRFSRICRTISHFPLNFKDLKIIFLPLISEISPLFLIKHRSVVYSPHLCFPLKEKYLGYYLGYSGYLGYLG